MLKKLIPTALTLALALTGLTASAQSTPPARPHNWCDFDTEQERYFNANPGAREAQKAMNQQLEVLSQSQRRGNAYVTDVTIPIVVHVLHAGGAENISDRQINSAIDQLNTTYQKLNADTAQTIPLFRPIAASVGFRFRLAKIDPNGNCTTGITRHYLPTTCNDDRTGAVQAVGVWDQARYLNVWVVRTMGGGAAGYVVPPNTSSNPRDGFTVLHDYFGTQGTGTLYRSFAATHEIGHYFGLSHPWGQTNNAGTGDCSGTDNVADTPPTDGSLTCNLAQATCGPIANVQNYMDYSYCSTMFTQGQRAFMRAVLASNRTSLTTQANLVSTGTNDGYAAPNCAPIASFAAAPGTGTSVCINTAVRLTDYSYNFSSAGGALTYSWSFPGGTPATATGSSVSVAYANAGFYAVTETVSNSAGSSTSSVTNYIRVEGPTGAEVAPYTESFENTSFPTLFPEPTLRNYTTSGFTSAGVAAANYRWVRQANVPAAAGSSYLVVQDRLIPAGATTQLITPNINLASVPTPATLTFARAFALRTVSSNEQLRVSFSSDCGVTWSTPAVLDVTALTTQGLTPIDGYVPTSSADWQTTTVAIPAQFQGSGLFKVRFQMVNGTTQGNNFFLDNLRVAGPLATKADALASRGISVYPNPMTNETAVHLNLTAATQVRVRLTDVLGRNVVSLPAKLYGAGQQSVSLQSAGHALKAGLYVVHISLDGETFTSKLTVE